MVTENEQLQRFNTQIKRLETTVMETYAYPNAVDFHTYSPGGGSHLCWHCGRAETYFLHEEPFASEYSRAVQKKRTPQPEPKQQNLKAAELTETHKKFIELDKKKEEIKKYYDEVKTVTEKLIAENGVDHYFQDKDGTVYKTIVPDGTFVTFKKYDVKRTRRGEEKKGELSLTEAREAGFEVEGK